MKNSVRTQLGVVVAALVAASLVMAGCGNKEPEKNATPPSGSSQSNPDYMKMQKGAPPK